MANEPRKHHYVPKFHLAGFTMSGTEDGQLFVTDKLRRNKWDSTPKKTARETDFYRVDLANMDPVGIEKAFSDVEGKCATVVRDVIADKRLPTGDDFGTLLNFVAISATRIPIIRSTIAAGIDGLMKQFGRQALLGPEGAKRLREIPENASMSDEEMVQFQAFIAGNDYTIDVDQNWHIHTMLEAIDALLPALAKRNWAVWSVAEGAPDLVCSDRPVALYATKQFPPLLPPGFGTPNTLLTLPLNRRVMLASQFEEMPAESSVIDRDDVAAMNSLQALHAIQVYSSVEDWVWVDGNGVAAGSQAYLDSLIYPVP